MVLAPPRSRLAVLLFTDIVGSMDLKSRLGTAAYLRMLDRHDAVFRRCVAACPGAEIIQDTGDGYFAVFPTASDAVRAALCFQDSLRADGVDGPTLFTRVGIHVGEVAEVPRGGGDGRPKIVGVSADCAARLMSLASGGQILLTRAAFDDARQFVHEHPSADDGRAVPPLKWVAHGPYLFSGIDDPVEVYEVGGDGVSPFTPPVGGDKARRSVAADQEETLGWRPAVGLTVPQRQGWMLDRRLGEGTFGEVWLARHERLKEARVFKFCFDSDRLRSFKREVTFFRLIRDALGERPDIARLYDVCLEHPPFFLESEYAPGGNLIDWAEAQGGLDRVPEKVRLDIVAKVASAVDAAHSVGILHKDIKPGNILIHTDDEGKPWPQLSDFGIGILVDTKRLADHQITEAGLTLLENNDSSRTGTRLYSPPESLRGRPFTTQGDIYALGVLLFQMVTGDLTRPVSVGWERDVADELLREDIAICIEGDPARRLASAREVATRLRTLPERRRARAEARRAHAAAARRVHLLRLGTLVALLAVVVGALAAVAYVREHGLRVRAEASDRRTQLAYAEGAVDQGAALHLAGRAVASRNAFMRARASLAALGQSTLAADVGLGRSLREFEAPINTLTGHTDGVMAVAWFPDGVRACSASEDGTVRIWDARTGVSERVLIGHKGAVMAVAVSPDGRHMLSVGEDQTVRLWDAATGAELRSYAEPDGPLRGVAFSPDGRRALFGPANPVGVVRLLDVTSGKPVARFEMSAKEGVYGVAFDAEGKRVLATTYQHGIWIWDASTGRLLHHLKGHGGYVISASFSADGRYVVSGGFDKTIKLWDAQSGVIVRTLVGHAAGIRGVAFTWGDEAVLSGSMDGTVRVWAVETGDVVRTFAGHRDGVRGIAVSHDGRRALTAGIDGTVKVWGLTRSAELSAIAEKQVVTCIASSPDGTMLITGDVAGAVRLRDAATLRLIREYPALDLPVDSVALPGDGRRLVAVDSAGTVRMWDPATGQVLATLPGLGPGESKYPRAGAWCFSAIAPDASVVATTTPDRTVEVRQLASGAVLRSLGPATHALASVAISPDSKTLILGDVGGEISHWDPSTGARLSSWAAGPKTGKIDTVAFSLDGKYVLAGGHDLTVRRWELATGKPAREFTGATLVIKGVAAGGRTVAAVGGEQVLRMWDADSGRELDIGANLARHGFALAVLPPGDVVLASGGVEVSRWDMTRPLRHVELGPQVDAARAALIVDRDDAPSLALLGEWYAFRGVNDWAITLLEQARAAGATVKALTLARCYWQRDQYADAAREFRMARANAEAPAAYLDLCLAAVESSAAAPPSTMPVGGSPSTSRAPQR